MEQKMKASELRLGNLVNWNGEIAKISQLLELEVAFKCGEYDLYENLKPIPLTEEWLLKFGFKKDNDGSCVKNDVAIFLDKRFKTNLFLQENQDMFKWFGYECKIKHIHQLQNLYFALTGEELTFKQQ